NTAGIVGDRAVSVNSNGQTGGGEHTYSSQRDTEQSHAAVSSAAHYKEGYDYADADEKHRPESRIHTNCQTGNNSGCRTGFGLLSDFLNTPEISRGIDLGDLANDHTNKQTCCNSPECIQRTKQAVRKISSSSDNDSTADVSTAVQ